jgi:hypothetical protein
LYEEVIEGLMPFEKYYSESNAEDGQCAANNVQPKQMADGSSKYREEDCAVKKYAHYSEFKPSLSKTALDRNERSSIEDLSTIWSLRVVSIKWHSAYEACTLG